jgi:uroporphyrinogen-III synthase
VIRKGGNRLASDGFQGLKVLTLESRRSAEIAKLIETYKGVPVSAPAMREVPLAENGEALQFGRDLLSGSVDVVVFLTGVGARALLETVTREQSSESFLQALRKTRVAARGPKPLAVMREWNVPVEITAPEPNTWRELLSNMESMSGGLHAQRVAVQEYGVSNPEFLSALRERGAIVRRVPVYQWALPHDTAPLRDAVAAVIEGTVSVVLFTTGVQANHLFQIASEQGKSGNLRAGFRKLMVASIGPSTTETLASLGVTADMEPSHPKMGILVKEAAERSAELLAEKSKD